MNEPRVVESVTNECQSLGRAHESSSARAEQLISCLEGEIAKRDARIVELGVELEGEREAARDGNAEYLELQSERDSLRAELAAIKAQEPVAEVDMTVPSAEIQWTNHGAEMCLQHGTKLYAAPVSEAKAHGNIYADGQVNIDQTLFGEIRMSEPVNEDGEPTRYLITEAQLQRIGELEFVKAQGVAMPAELDRAFITGESCDGVYQVVIQSETLKEMHAVHRWLTRLNASHVQVSVPDERAAFEAMCDKHGYIKTRHLMSDNYKDQTLQLMWESWQSRAMLAAAPAAPAADAGAKECEHRHSTAEFGKPSICDDCGEEL